MSIQKLEKAIELSKSFNASNDISFCNPDNRNDKCYKCKRFLMHLKHEYNMRNEVDEQDIFYSYFTNPDIDCQKYKFKYFIEIKKEKL